MIRSGRGLIAAAVVFVRGFSGTALALGLVPSLVRAASDTWSVNVGGSGDFADLQQAVDHAQPGDTILLWGPANGRQLLDSVTIAKGLTIVGLAPERVHLKEIHVRDVPAGQSVTIVNVVVGDYHVFPWTDDVRTLKEAALVEDCAGTVVFSGCLLRGGILWFDTPPDSGGPGVRAVRSDVVLLDCEVVGGRGGDVGESITGQANMQHALVLEDARALVAGSVLHGGDGMLTALMHVREVGGRGGDGVRAVGASSLWLLDSTALGGMGEDIYTFPPGGLGRGGDGGNGVRVGPLARAYARATTIEGGAGGWEPTNPGRDGRDVVGELEVLPGSGLALDLAPWTRDVDPIDARLHGIPNAGAYLLVGEAARFRAAGSSGVLAADAPVTIPLGPMLPTGELAATVPLPALAHGEARLLVVQSAFDEPTGRVLGEPRPLLVLDARWLPDGVQRFHVDAAAPPGGDGRSWATAFPSLREALEAATGIGPGVTDVWVREGVYRPIPAGPVPLEPFYVKSRTRVYGGFAGTETDLAQRNPALHPTVLSGDLLGDDDASDASRAENSRLVLAIGPLERRESVRLDGLVFASGFGGPMSSGSTFPFSGSGVMLQGSVDVVGCTFTDIRRGCALEAFGDLRVVGCRFLGNHGTMGSGSYGMGTCRVNGDGNSSGQAVFTNCEFTGNSTVRGAAILTSAATLVSNCTFYGNSAEQEGGALQAYYHCPSLIVENSLLWGNQAPSGPDISVAGQAYLRVDFSLFQGGSTSPWGTGNVDGPPRLFNPEGPDGVLGTFDDDLTPRSSSPAVDAGNDAFLPSDVLDLDLDGDVAEPLPFDAAGSPREADDPNVPDTGSGTSPIVDIGSRERP